MWLGPQRYRAFVVCAKARDFSGSYKRGHVTGVGGRSYAAVVVAWAMCGEVHDATEHSSVESRPGRLSRGRQAKVGLALSDGSHSGWRSLETRCGSSGSNVGQRSMEKRCDWLDPTTSPEWAS